MNKAETLESRGRADLAASSPLSSAQRAIWFLDRSGSAGAYNIARAWRLEGHLDMALLEQSHRLVVGRHEILRTRIVEYEGIPEAIIDDGFETDFEVREMSEDAAHAFLESEASKPFDLSADPVWRVRVVRLAEDEHILLDVVHHIAADGWSLPRLRYETAQFYASALKGTTSDLSPAVQYRDVIETSPLPPTEIDRRLAYWSANLDGAKDATLLRTDRPRPTPRSADGFWVRAVVDGLSGDDLDRISGMLDATPSMIGLSVYAVGLARYSDSSEVVIGIPSTGRTDPLDQGVIGPYFNSLPIRLSIEPEMSFRELVDQTRSQVLGALDNEVPLEEIVRVVDPPRVPGQTPIFQTMFQHRDPSFREGYGFAGVRESAFDLEGATAKFDLLLEVGAGRAGLELSLNLSADLFDRSTGQSLVGGLAELARQVFAAPNRPLSSASMATSAQQGWLTQHLTGGRHPLPRIESLAAHYQSLVEGRENEVAIFDGQSISHRDLLDASAEIEASLIKAGVGAGSVVALILERSAAMVAAMIAVNRIRAIYVPIDPEFPAERIGSIVEIAGAVASISPNEGGSWADVDVDVLDRSNGPAAQPSKAVYMMFTSGSTGSPKGVVVSEDAVLRLVSGTDYVSLDPGDVVGHLSNVAFDAATFEIWAPLLNGGSIAVIDRETALTPRKLQEELTRRSVKTLFVTTALFNLIARQKPETFAGLRDVLFGGERCDPGAVRRIRDAGPPQRLVHVYGPTETTTFASWYEVPLADSELNTVPIGGPISNTSLYVLDAWGQPIPPGLVGELYVGGPGVAIGYVGDESGTNARFRQDPFSDDPWGRMYRTGDLVKVDEAGEVEFVGRGDRQLKLRGFRIEPEEIERVLLDHRSVEEAVVRLVDSGDPRLMAWVTTNGAAVSAEELREHVSSILPRFMVPIITLVDRIPIGPTGKIDATLLPGTPSDVLTNSPASATEARVIELFEKVLKVSGIGRSDDFFDLGGHSIRAVELVALVEKEFGVRFGVVEMWEGPTPAEIAARVETGDLGSLERRLVTLAEGRSDPLFIFHHPSGTVQGYTDLAQALPEEVAVIGVNAAGVDGTVDPSTDLVDMAAEYASLLTTAQPDGEFRLVGHSLGGLLAWETARNLTNSGRSVEFLGLIDTQLPRGSVATGERSLADWFRSAAHDTYRNLHRRAGDVKWGSKRLWKKLRGQPIPADLARTNLVRASSKAFDSYRPIPIDTAVSYFLATGKPGSDGGKIQPEWIDLCASLDVIPVPGMHSGPDSILFPPNVSILADEMARRLAPVTTE